jgi:SynChlorMet cassette radical SAM/SPASM protein ScmF
MLNTDATTEPRAAATPPVVGQLYCYLTEGCNLACRHCWLSPPHEGVVPSHAMLPVALFEKVVDQAVPLGLAAVKLTGGEPLLHPDFTGMLRIAHNRGLRVLIETNGVLCTAAIANRIAELDNPSVSVSLDSPDPAVHDSFRGVAGSHAAAVAALRLLVERSVSLQVVMSLTKANAHQVDAMVEFVEHIGATSLKFNIVQPAGRGASLERARGCLEVAELIEIGRVVDRYLNNNLSAGIVFDYPAAFRPLSRLVQRDGCGACGIMCIMGLTAKGQYALCGIGSYVEELNFGDARTESLEKIWRDNPLLRELRAGMPGRLQGVCGRCLMRESCLGSCVAQNFLQSGSLWAPFWFCQEAFEQGLFPGSRLECEP